MRIYLTLLVSLISLTAINYFPQQLPTDYFQENIEVYFSFEVSTRDLIQVLTNVISIDNVEGTTVYAYANENEYNEFLSYKLAHTILPKPGELIIPEMTDNIDDITSNIQSDSPDPEEILINQQRVIQLREIVNQLKPGYKSLIELRYFKEYSYEEISIALNIPIGTVKAQLYRAKSFIFNIINKTEIKR